MSAEAPLLRVESLGVTWPGRPRPVLHDVHLTLSRGECIGLAGPSGAGKSTLALALLRLLPARAEVSAATRITLGGAALHALDDAAMAALRGRRIGMVFQEPALALHPSIRIGALISEGLVTHGLADAREAQARAVEMLARVGVPDARAAARRFAHEFSGGMRQRILLASALVLGPDVLIVDEPTTALDMTIQAQILDLLDSIRAEHGTAMLHISHDPAVLGERADRVLRLEGGTLIPATSAPAAIGTTPSVVTPLRAAPVLEVSGLSVRYLVDAAPGTGVRDVRAVEDIAFSIGRGEAFGLVGESGSGKSSVAHALMRLADARGTMRFDGVDLGSLRGTALREMRRRIQLVPQDAGASLTPHLTVETLVAEGPVAHRLATWEQARAAARALLERLRLPPESATALAGELSAGQRQRVAIARALALRPELLICDEPVSALDPETRTVVLDLLSVMQREHTMSLLVITHDLASVMRITSRVAVMYAGRIVESGPTVSVVTEPRMPFTRALIDAVPSGDPLRRGARVVLAGEPPSPLSPPSGCAFNPRCPHPLRDAECTRVVPPLVGDDVRRVACLKQ